MRSRGGASGLPLTPAGLLGAFLLLVLLRAILVLARDVYALRIQLLIVPWRTC